VPASARTKTRPTSEHVTTHRPGFDPPRLGGWMSLSRFAQTSDVRWDAKGTARSVPTRSPADERHPLLQTQSCYRRLTFRARSAQTPSGLGRGAAIAPGRRPSCSESSPQRAWTDILRQVVALHEGIAHPFARLLRDALVKEHPDSRRARPTRPDSRKNLGKPIKDASGRLLQSTFQRRAPGR
jgi:hypothetical protein